MTKNLISTLLVAFGLFAIACTDSSSDTGTEASQPSETSAAQRLERLITVNFEQESLSDVIDQFRNLTRVNIFVPWPALEAVGISQKTSISLKLQNIPASDVMKRILEQASDQTPNHTVTFFVSDGILTISEPKKSAS